MQYNEAKPCAALTPYIHSFWQLKGDDDDNQWERIFPDGCPGLVINLGQPSKTDNGLVTMDYGRTYVVGAMTSFKDTFVDAGTRLFGICLKPAAFASFYKYAPQSELTNRTVEFDRSYSFEPGKIGENPIAYLNKFFIDRKPSQTHHLQSVLKDIHSSKGKLSVHDISRRHFTPVRQLERQFKIHIGVTPKEYANIIRFQSALSMIKHNSKRNLLDIAIECGFYDRAHLTNALKRNTGFAPSQL